MTSKLIKFRTRSSSELQDFDISDESLQPFGFKFGDRVTIPDDRYAWVVGVREYEPGRKALWFHIDGDSGTFYRSYNLTLGASHYGDGRNNKETFESKGIFLVASRDNVNEYLSKMWRDDEFADVTFIVGERKIRAHRCVLAHQSDYFRALFKNGMKESGQSQISMQNINPDVFENLIQFFYFGSVQITNENITEMISIADMFQILSLKRLCYLQFPSMINNDNAISLLLFFDQNKEEKLKKIIFNYIVENISTIKTRDDFKSVLTENQNLMLELLEWATSKSDKDVKYSL